MKRSVIISIVLLLLLWSTSCVDWNELTPGAQDAGTPADAGADAGVDPNACVPGPVPGEEPVLPPSTCPLSAGPLLDDNWERHPFAVAGTDALTISARGDQLVIVDGDALHFFCGTEEATDLLSVCNGGPHGQIDQAADGSLVIGLSGGACVVRPPSCECFDVPEASDHSAVAAVSAESFVVLIQRQDDTDPVLEERALANPGLLISGVTLTGGPRAGDPPTLTRLPRPCASQDTWAVAVHFQNSRELFTITRRAANENPTVALLDPTNTDGATGIVAAPVGSAPGSASELIGVRISSLPDIEVRRGVINADGAALDGLRRGGPLGRDDSLGSRCATRLDGRFACPGPAALLVTDDSTGASAGVAIPAAIARYGDSTDAASLGDDAWIIGNDFVAHRSLSTPLAAPAATVRTNVTANLVAGSRVLGAPFAQDHLLLASPSGSAVVTASGGELSVTGPSGDPIDAVAIGAAGVPGAGVLAWVDRGTAQIQVQALSDSGEREGIPLVVTPGIDGDLVAIDTAFGPAAVSLWIGSLEQLVGDPSRGRLTLQHCVATAAAGVDASCEGTLAPSVDVLLRDGVLAGAKLVLLGNDFFFVSSGGVTAIELESIARASIGAVASEAVPIRDGVDPLQAGVQSVVRTPADCLYIAAGRTVLPIQLALGDPVDSFDFIAPVQRELEAQAMLVMGDDSILVGSGRGRLGRFQHDLSGPCVNTLGAVAFAASDGPLRATGDLKHAVFVGDDLYVVDEDNVIWRVPLP